MVSVSHYKEFYSLIGSLVGVTILSKELDDKSNLTYKNNIMDNEMWMRFEDNINIQVGDNKDYWINTDEIYLIMDEPNVFTLSLGNVNYKGDFKKIENVIGKLFFYNEGDDGSSLKLLKLKWEYGNLCELTEFLGCEECKECYVEVDGEGGFDYSTPNDIYGKLRECWSKCDIKTIDGQKYYVK